MGSTPAFETSSLAQKYHHALKVHHLDSLCFFFLVWVLLSLLMSLFLFGILDLLLLF